MRQKVHCYALSELKKSDKKKKEFKNRNERKLEGDKKCEILANLISYRLPFPCLTNITEHHIKDHY